MRRGKRRRKRKTTRKRKEKKKKGRKGEKDKPGDLFPRKKYSMASENFSFDSLLFNHGISSIITTFLFGLSLLLLLVVSPREILSVGNLTYDYYYDYYKWKGKREGK